MKDINLLQGIKSENKTFDPKANSRPVLIALGGLFVLLLVIYIGMISANSYYVHRTRTIQAEAASYSAVGQVKNSIAQKTADIKNIQELLNTASGASYIDTHFLWTISSALNSNTFLTNMALTANNIVNFSGKSATRKDIAYFVYNLKKTKLFSDVAVNMVNTQTQDKMGDTYDFVVTATVKGGAEVE